MLLTCEDVCLRSAQQVEGGCAMIVLQHIDVVIGHGYLMARIHQELLRDAWVPHVVNDGGHENGEQVLG